MHTPTHGRDVAHHHATHDHHSGMIGDYKRRFFLSCALTLPMVFLSFSSFSQAQTIQASLATLVFSVGGWPFLKGAVVEIRAHSIGMMALVALGISVAYSYSLLVFFGLSGSLFWLELASLIDIMLLGHWLEMKAILGAGRSLEKLAQLLPKMAHLRMNGQVIDVPFADLKKGHHVLIRPGENIPADGIVIEGSSTINESLLTGESLPVKKIKGDELVAGSSNTTGALTLEVTKDPDQFYLFRVLDLVKSAQANKSHTQRLADRAANKLTWIAIAAGALTFCGWLWAGAGVGFSLERMVAVLVTSCPHALGLAIPLVVAISTSLGARNGILVRNRTALEDARKISTVVFDKTGTLTEGVFSVQHIDALLPSLTSHELLHLAGSLEMYSEHPIALSIVQKMRSLGMAPEQVESFQSHTGMGVSGYIRGRLVELLSQSAAQGRGLNLPQGLQKANPRNTLVFVALEGELAGVISLSDEIRPQSYQAVNQLKALGIQVVMLTGDHERVAQAVAQSLQVDLYFAQVLPEQKLQIVGELQSQGEFVAMVGDGINDAPALAKADVGIAMGAGTDIAAETAGIILVNSSPADVSKVVMFGRATFRKMRQNLFWAAGYNLIALQLAGGVLAPLGIVLTPTLGAVLMSFSTIAVALNAQTLQVWRKRFT